VKHIDISDAAEKLVKEIESRNLVDGDLSNDTPIQKRRGRPRKDDGTPNKSGWKKNKTVVVDPLAQAVMATLDDSELAKDFCIVMSPIKFAIYLDKLVNADGHVYTFDVGECEDMAGPKGAIGELAESMNGIVKVSRKFFGASEPFSVAFDKRGLTPKLAKIIEYIALAMRQDFANACTTPNAT